MKYTIFILCIGLSLVGCLDTVTDPRPGPITETDAELFDAPPFGQHEHRLRLRQLGCLQFGAPMAKARLRKWQIWLWQTMNSTAV